MYNFQGRPSGEGLRSHFAGVASSGMMTPRGTGGGGGVLEPGKSGTFSHFPQPQQQLGSQRSLFGMGMGAGSSWPGRDQLMGGHERAAARPRSPDWMMPPGGSPASFKRYLDAAFPTPQPHELDWIPEGIDEMLLDRNWLNPSQYAAVSALLGYDENGVRRPWPPGPIPSKRRIMSQAEMKQRLKSGDYNWLDFTSLSNDDHEEFLFGDPTQKDPRFDIYSFENLTKWGMGAYYNPWGAGVPGHGRADGGGGGGLGLGSSGLHGHGLQSMAPGMRGGGGRAPPGFGLPGSGMNLGGGGSGLLGPLGPREPYPGGCSAMQFGGGQGLAHGSRPCMSASVSASTSTLQFGGGGRVANGLAGSGSSMSASVSASRFTMDFGGGVAHSSRMSAAVPEPKPTMRFDVGVGPGPSGSRIPATAAMSTPRIQFGVGSGARRFGTHVPPPVAGSTSTMHFGAGVAPGSGPRMTARVSEPAKQFGFGAAHGSRPTMTFGVGRGRGFGSPAPSYVPKMNFGVGRGLGLSGTRVPTPMPTAIVKIEKSSPPPRHPGSGSGRVASATTNNRPFLKVTPLNRPTRPSASSTSTTSSEGPRRAPQPQPYRLQRPKKEVELDPDILPEPEIVHLSKEERAASCINPLTGRVREVKVKYKCTLCGKQYLQRCGYHVHYNTAHLGIRFRCQVCNKAYVRKCSLMTHLGKAKCSAHGRAKENQCGLCGNVFSTPGALKKHANSAHPQQKGFRCDICGKMYRWKKDMNAHRRRHRRRTDKQ